MSQTEMPVGMVFWLTLSEIRYRPKEENWTIRVLLDHLVRHHNENDIPMYLPVAEGLHQICGLMQGGEYVVNKEVTEKYVARIQEFNAYKGDEEYKPIQSLSMTDTTRIFNTNGIKGDLSVLMEGEQFIVNRAATIKHYEELEQINNSVTHELRGT